MRDYLQNKHQQQRGITMQEEKKKKMRLRFTVVDI
jgi:hypothetical protein